jgi:hypothetical protein
MKINSKSKQCFFVMSMSGHKRLPLFSQEDLTLEINNLTTDRQIFPRNSLEKQAYNATSNLVPC